MENQAFLNNEPKEENFPKYIDFNVEEMKNEQIKYLVLILGLGILMFFLSFLPGESFFYTFKLFGASVVLSAIIMFVMLGINSARAVRTVVIEQDKFTVNGDVYIPDVSTEVRIGSRFGYAGKADNIYLTVKSRAGSRRYWVGIVADISAGAARAKLQNELVRTFPTLVK